ncbi:retropepsin-like aspartic protease [Sediminibacterium ginsengisoli]|uniref:Aspartyl protease n=1 Tax=Sediminibacterium ginsengisoli TaxID=413434 RepID=A0A1T4KM32_9BACT|nr:retropepsin-like aspartic protease [Sediminibacterium ginsengisoli]SJZ43466.1 Aspartyl protease [Sediminibacterium ginsengisoli]
MPIIISFFLVICTALQAQEINNDNLYTREGIFITKKRLLIASCLKSLQADKDDPDATKICDCQVSLLNNRYTRKEVEAYTVMYKEQALIRLMEADSKLQQTIPACVEKDSSLNLFAIPAFVQSFRPRLATSIRQSYKQEISQSNLQEYCNCVMDVFTKRGFTLRDEKSLSDPNSLLYNELAYTCGSPVRGKEDAGYIWQYPSQSSVVGNKLTDTIQTIQIANTTRVKVRIGKDEYVWLLDSGASDLLVSGTYAKQLLQDGLLKQDDLIGNGNYLLADGREIACRRYRINGIQIGSYILNDIVLAVSDEVRHFLLGKSVLNKFSSWTVDNRLNALILVK